MSLVPSPSRSDYYTALRAFLLSVLPTGIEVVQAQDNRVPQPVGTDFVTMNEVMRRRMSTDFIAYADCAVTGSVAGNILTVTATRLGPVRVGAPLLGIGVATGITIASQQSGTTGGAGVYVLSAPVAAPVSDVTLACGIAKLTQPTAVTVQLDIYGPGSSDNVGTVTTLLRDDYATLWFSRTGWSGRGIDMLDVEDPRQTAFIDGEAQYEDRWTLDVQLQVNQVVTVPQDFADAVTVKIRPPAY